MSDCVSEAAVSCVYHLDTLSMTTIAPSTVSIAFNGVCTHQEPVKVD